MSAFGWDYLDEYRQERTDILDAVETVFESGQLILGESVGAFEREFAAYLDVPHCVGVDNATNAIAAGLQVLGVGPGDEVVTVSNTAAPTVVAIDAVGATPVFVDVRADDYLMDIGRLQDAITEHTRCLLPVHLYGQCVDMDAVLALAQEHGLAVVEDCAQAHGARYRGRTAGSMGDLAAFSFYPTKVLGAYGDGGAVTCRNGEIDGRLRRMRFYGMEPRGYVVETPGRNSRLDTLQAEILRRKLRRLDGYLDARRAIAQRYREGLGDVPGLVLPTTATGNDHVYYMFVVRHPERDRILDELASYDVHLSVSYRWPVHTMSGFAHLNQPVGSLPVTERLAGEVFSLPMYPTLPPGTQDKVIDAVRHVVTGSS